MRLATVSVPFMIVLPQIVLAKEVIAIVVNLTNSNAIQVAS